MATVSIADQLKVLQELQELDKKLYELRSHLKAKPAEEASLKAQLKDASLSLQKQEGEVKALEVKRNQMEIELGEKETQIKKLQTQLYQIKTNKEYSALQKEIEGFKADRSVLEEEVLKLMEEIDRWKERLRSERESLKVQEKIVAESLARLEEESKAVEHSIEELQETRRSLTPKVDAPILAQYDRILERKEGLALVPVKNGACGGCHMVLPPQTINEIQMAPHLITCGSCTRVLYVESTA